ncbi:uncharacterized protein [Haliotis cracherodii]|uniref:uncharacterized protein isoform X2 n=1 Tax=Haliotis cracherodii TaxID=6455 RepID=UPI0039ED0B07
MWTAGLLVCCLHCVYATSVNISTGTKHLYITENENTWWEARKNCKTELQSDLYIVDTEPLPSVLDEFLNNNTFYWVGAMRYSTWIWTDDTPLYSYVGYTKPGSNPKYLLDNSVYECHLACRNKDRTFGLSGNKCYCHNETHAATAPTAVGMQCPGNLDEMCGDEDVMSVYTLGAGNFRFTPTQHGACAYAMVNDPISVYLNHYRNCLTQKRIIPCYENISQESNCNGGVCVSIQDIQQSWVQAYDKCPIVKLDNSTTWYLKKHIHSGDRIWIGLAFKVSRKWINGKDANGYEDYYPFINSPIQMCLALKNDGARKLYWVPCSLHLSSICEAPTSSTTLGSSNGGISTEGQVSNQDDGVGQSDTQTGLYIGLAAGSCILLLIIIAVVCFVRRRRKIRLEITDEQRIFNTATENMTYDIDVPRDNEAISVSPDFTPVPKATVNPTTHTEKAYMNHPGTNVESEYNYDHVDATEGNYDTVQQGGNARTVDESYSRIGKINKKFEEGAYDTTNTGLVVNRFDDTYSHTSESDNKTSDYCNTRSVVRDDLMC